MFEFRRTFLSRRCLLCQDSVEDDEWICRYCRQNLPLIDSACPVCGMPAVCNTVCGRCLASPPYYHYTIAPLRFQPPVTALVYRLKYHHQFFLARALATELARHILKSSTPLPELIIPLPLHRKRLRRRGFNQSQMLARALSRQLGIACDSTHLVRRRYARPQVELDADDRKRAVDNAFAARPGLKVQHIALVDDVISTSHTANQAARALKRAGIKSISIWAIARNT